MSDAVSRAIRNHTGGVIETQSRTEISKGVFVTDEIPRVTAYEDTGGTFFFDAECTRPDTLVDDQALAPLDRASLCYWAAPMLAS